MTGEWGVGVQLRSAAWMDVPAGLAGDGLDEWVDVSLAGLREHLGAQWRDDHDDEVRAMLRAAATRPRDGKILDLLFWPVAGPVVVRVGFRVLPHTPLSAWIDDGFEVDAFDSAPMGPGVRCIATADVVDGATQRTAITAQYVFDDGTNTVQVEVEPTLIELFSYVSLDIVALLGGLQVRRPDGDRFVPTPVEGYTLDEVDKFVGNSNG